MNIHFQQLYIIQYTCESTMTIIKSKYCFPSLTDAHKLSLQGIIWTSSLQKPQGKKLGKWVPLCCKYIGVMWINHYNGW